MRAGLWRGVFLLCLKSRDALMAAIQPSEVGGRHDLRKQVDERKRPRTEAQSKGRIAAAVEKLGARPLPVYDGVSQATITGRGGHENAVTHGSDPAKDSCRSELSRVHAHGRTALHWSRGRWLRQIAVLANCWWQRIGRTTRLEAAERQRGAWSLHDRNIVLQRAAWLQARRHSHPTYLRSALSWAPQSHGPIGSAGPLWTAQSLVCRRIEISGAPPDAAPSGRSRREFSESPKTPACTRSRTVTRSDAGSAWRRSGVTLLSPAWCSAACAAKYTFATSAPNTTGSWLREA